MLPETELLPPQVLVVDANVRHCLLYRMEMEAHGYAVSCAHNGREALVKLRDRRFDLAGKWRSAEGVHFRSHLAG